jgi:hypothetical protein
MRGFAIARGRRRGSARDVARIKKAAREFCDGDAQLSPQAALQAAIILRSAEHIANQVAKRGRIIQQLYHARGDGTAQKISAEYFLRDVGGEFQVRGKSGAQLRGLQFGLACDDRLRQQIARAQRVI